MNLILFYSSKVKLPKLPLGLFMLGIQIALALFFVELAIKMWYTAFQRLGILPSMSRGQIHHSLMIPTGIGIPYSLAKVALVGSGQGIVHCVSGM